MQWRECDGLFVYDYLKMNVGKELVYTAHDQRCLVDYGCLERVRRTC